MASCHSSSLSWVRIGHLIPAFFCLAATALGVALAIGQGGDRARSERAPASSPASVTTSRTPILRSTPPVVEKRFREGSAITDQAGSFKVVGERVVFSTSDGKTSTVCLENLNLERIVRAIADSTDRLEWRVNGTLTEYSGANYLLVERAILRSRVSPRETH